MREIGGAEELRERLRSLEELAPFAPRAVDLLLEEMSNDLRFVFPERRAIARLRDRLQQRSWAPSDPASCAFPVVTRCEGWLEGAVLQAVVTADRRPGASTVEDVFPEERKMLELLCRRMDALPIVLPNPLLVSTRLCELVGDSGGAAFALAQEAARRGVPVPRDIALSAALDVDEDGELLLAPVSACDQKRRVLERERPGCRFFFLAEEGEEVGPSSTIELIPLEPGPFRALCDRLLPDPGPSYEELARQVEAAEAHFAGQRYGQSRDAWRRLYRKLPSLAGDPGEQRERWRLLTLSRLGAIELHAGRPTRASLFFGAARSVAARLARPPAFLLDEVQINVAGAQIDRLRPREAAAILAPLLERWRRELAEDPTGLERQMMLIACLGAQRRRLLLLGEASRAVEIQEELMGWTPTSEQPRAHADLGECLRRAGRHGEARRAFEVARASLYRIPLESYRIQTEAFLTFYEGRLALDQGSEGPSLLYLESIREVLGERSAARWRLLQLARLLRLREGDADAARELVGELDHAENDFARWNAVLGLLRGARVARREGPLLRREAAEALASLGACTARYPALEAARLEYVASVRAEKNPEWAERLHLRLSPY